MKRNNFFKRCCKVFMEEGITQYLCKKMAGLDIKGNKTMAMSCCMWRKRTEGLGKAACGSYKDGLGIKVDYGSGMVWYE